MFKTLNVLKNRATTISSIKRLDKTLNVPKSCTTAISRLKRLDNTLNVTITLTFLARSREICATGTLLNYYEGYIYIVVVVVVVCDFY